MKGILLCGGKSSRMGQKKQWLPLGGQPLLVRLAKTMRTVCEEITIVVHDEEDAAQVRACVGDVKIARDLYPGQGPLAGLHAGLQDVGEDEIVCLVACDLPFLRAEVLQEMHTMMLQNPYLQAVIPADGRHVYPVCGLYRGQVRGLVADCLEKQDNAVRHLLAKLRVRYVSTERWADLKPSPLLNMNTPEAYQEVCALWEKEGFNHE